MPLWDRVVNDHLISDVPLGVLQSGGIDSALIACSVAHHGKIPLFTAAFAESSHDETANAALVAQHTSLPHRIVKISADPEPDQTLRTVVHHYDGQVADESSGPLLLLTRALRRHSIVALSGDGGDEFFGGYPTYRASRVTPLLPASLAALAGRLAYSSSGADETRLPMQAVFARFMLGIAAGRRHAHVEWRRFLPDFLASRVYGPALTPLLGQSPTAEYRAVMDVAAGDTLLDRCLIADQSFHLPSGLLMKTDAMSMANSVEIRVPLLDRRIMEFSGRCNLSLLVPSSGPSKPLLRCALERIGAPKQVWSAGKRGFNNPLAALLRGELKPLCERIFERNPDVLQPYLRPDAVREIWREHAHHRCNHAYALWPMLTLALWRSELEGHPV